MTADAIQRPGARSGIGRLTLLLVVVVVGIAINLAVPAVRRARLAFRVQRILADVEAIRAGALAHFERTGTWPRERPAGRTPTDLVNELERPIRWTQEDVVYDWENWLGPGGGPQRPPHRVGIGISVRTDDARLLELLEEATELETETIHGWGITFVILAAPDSS